MFVLIPWGYISALYARIRRLDLNSNTMQEGKIPWRRKWQSNPVPLPGKSHGQRSLVGYSPWGRKELDMTQRLHSLQCRKDHRRTNELTSLHLFRVLPRECTGHSKHPLSTTQEKTLHMDITRWSTPKSDWLYSLQPKMEKLYTISKNKTGSWLWLRSWTPYCQTQT